MHKLRGESATCRCQNHHAPGKAHATGSCGTAVTILLTGLLSHGLATHNECDTVFWGTLDALLWNHISEACKRNHPVRCINAKMIARSWKFSGSLLPRLHLYLGDSVAFSVYSFYSSFYPPSPSNVYQWTPVWVYHSSVAEPSLSGQSTYFGLSWHICGYHSLERFALSQCGYPHWTLNMNTWLSVTFFWCLCVSVKQWPGTGRACGPSALLFVSLRSCSRKHLWNTVRWQQSKPRWSKLINGKLLEATRRWRNHHTPGEAHAVYPYGSAVVVAIEGVAGSRPGYLQWMNVILLCWAPLTPCLGITSLKFAREIPLFAYANKLTCEQNGRGM